MLVRVGLDPDAAAELAAGGRAPGAVPIRFLLERCVVSVESAPALADLLKAFRDCGQADLAQAVAMLLHSPARTVVGLKKPTTAAIVPMTDMLEQADAESWRDLADLLLVAEERATLLGEPWRPEVATLRTAWNTSAYARSDELWQGLLPAGTKRAEIWHQRLKPLADTGCDVYVIERWACVNLYEHLRARTPRAPECGAVWFLSALARARTQRVFIACSERFLREKNLDPAIVLPAIQTWWRSLSPRSDLELKLVPGDFDHARGLAFDGWAGFSPHNGLASFDGLLLKERLMLTPTRQLADEIRRDFQALRFVAP